MGAETTDGTARPRIAFGDGPWAPTVDPATVAGLCGLDDPAVLLGWTVEELPWLEAMPPGRVTSVSAGYRLGKAIAAGVVEARSTAISAMPALLAGDLRPDVAVVSGRPAGTGFVFGPSVGWAHAAARLATKGVVVDVRPGLPAYDAPPIPGEILGVVEGPPVPPAPAGRAATATEEAIGAAVAALIPPGATVEFGIGTICEAAAAALSVGVRVRSGMVTDALVRLERRGLLLDRAETTYAWGGDDLAALSAGGRLRLVPSDESHDVDRLAAFEQFTAVNSALEVGLDGAVNVERLHGRPVAGIGGHADFCAAATRSAGGLSIVALTATRRGRSTIVPVVEAVSTPGSDVDVVVTEHGVADLRGADEAERRRRLIAIAAPEFES
ncbi:MAG TPA: acetyl-CoA hydrolase/transferase C-terminal domain-containing protein [Acidimicrobiia bacterium]|nr:acetyl-CoA hydrolase/transferase C-terminal domain-containing protein [Acidimicrobiia bacterium]